MATRSGGGEQPQVAIRSWIKDGGDLSGGRAADGARDGEARARGEAERWPRLGAGDEAGEGEDERASAERHCAHQYHCRHSPEVLHLHRLLGPRCCGVRNPIACCWPGGRAAGSMPRDPTLRPC